MKHLMLFFFVLSFTALTTCAQKYSVMWGDDTRMKKATVDMKLIDADNTGAYFIEGDLKAKMFAGVSTNYKLKKFDAGFNEVYEKEYSKIFRDVSISSFNPLKNKLYVFADHYNKKENVYAIYAAQINKENGEALSEMKEIGNYTLNSDRDDVNYVLKPTPDSTQWILITNIVPRDKSSNDVYITLLDEKLNKKANATIRLKQDPDLFSFADVTFTSNGKILILGKEYEYLNGSTKRKNRVFKNFSLVQYNLKGVQESDYKLDGNTNKYCIGGKLITLPNDEIIFTGFYSNIPRGKKQQLNGIYTARIDPLSNTITQNSALEISVDMLTDISDSTAADEDDGNNKKSKKNDDDNDEGFSNTFLIRNLTINPLDKSIIMIAESYKYDVHYFYTPPMPGSPGSNTVTYVFTNKDLMLINISPDGQLKKISVLPKKQRESFSETRGIGLFELYDGGLFAQGGSFPYYSSVSSLIYNNKLIIFFNDDKRNQTVKSGIDAKRVKWIRDFNKSSLFALSIDLATGTAKKDDISDNSEDDVAMPRFGFVAGNIVYLPASKQKMLGKTELKIGKIIIKD